MLAIEFVWNIRNNDRYSTSPKIDIEPVSQLSGVLVPLDRRDFPKTRKAERRRQVLTSIPGKYTHICHPHCLAQFISPHLCFCNVLEGLEGIS